MKDFRLLTDDEISEIGWNWNTEYEELYREYFASVVIPPPGDKKYRSIDDPWEAS